MFVGGANADVLSTGGLYGQSQSVDVGNFDTSEFVFIVLDEIGIDAETIETAPNRSRLDVATFGIALTVSHEAAHSFGLFHTSRTGDTLSIIDANVDLQEDYQLGIDDIFGTADDTRQVFPNRDLFNQVEGYLGYQRVAANLAWSLSTGKAGLAGSPLTGRVFVDVNRDGSLTTGESGLAGVTVFNDANGNGVLDTGELRTTSAADGSFALAVGIGTQRVVAVNPNTATFRNSSNSKTVTVTGSGATANLGFSQLTNSPTGTKWADLNGDGIKDATEPGLSGVFIYLDLDEDGRIDIGEPRTVTIPTVTLR